MTVNGQPVSAEVEPRTLLVHFLREDLRLTGTHVGCETGYCGACTVHVDGEPVKSCTMFAVQADGANVTTIEGIASNGDLHPVQEGFWERHVLQFGCGSSGMSKRSLARLSRTDRPCEDEIRRGMEGSLCRCTGYHVYAQAGQCAAARMRGGEPPAADWVGGE